MCCVEACGRQWKIKQFLIWICRAHQSPTRYNRHPLLNLPAKAICLHKRPASKAMLVWLLNYWNCNSIIFFTGMHPHRQAPTECDTLQCLLTGSRQRATLPSAQVIMMMLHQCQRGHSWGNTKEIQTHTQTIVTISCFLLIYDCQMRVINYSILVPFSVRLVLCFIFVYPHCSSES